MYITAQDLYDEGLSEVAYNQAYVEARILTCQSVIERITRKWFESRPQTYKLDGTGDNELRLPAPIITITSVRNKVDSQGWESMNLANFEIYNSLPEDWENPIIAIANFNNRLDVGNEWDIFPTGRRNIEVVGTFGYVEADGTTPLDIQLATKLLARELMPSIGDDQLEEVLAQRGMKREDVKGHEWERFESGSVGLLTGNADVDRLIKQFVGGAYGGGTSSVV